MIVMKYGLVRALVTVFATAAVLALAGCGDSYVREEFTKQVMHKSEAEVTKIIGKPVVVETPDPDHVNWIFYAKTVDPDHQNKRDTKEVVMFTRNTASNALEVTDVKYEGGR